MTEIPSVNERIKVTTLTQTKMMKDPINPIHPRRPRALTIVLSTQTEGLLFSAEPSDTYGGDIEISTDFKMREHRDTPD